jgi:hypothetical protein
VFWTNLKSIQVKITKIHKDIVGTLNERNMMSKICGFQGSFFSVCYDKNGLVYFVLKDYRGQKVTVHVIIEDKIGNIWIGYDRGTKFDGNYFTMYYEKMKRK